MQPSDIPHLRLHNQRISAPGLPTPAEVVGWLCASQAQEYAGAKWAIGLRMPHTTDSQLDQAIDAGSILRTHLLRPTWHFVIPQDIRWLLALTGPRVHAVNASRYRQLELDPATLKQCHEVMARALGGGKQLTRSELSDALHNAGVPSASGSRLAHIMMSAELDGVVCSGARRGRQFTYALLEERVPPVKTLQRDEALAELARRYFNSRGPATVQDFARWSGLTMADSQSGLEAVKTGLEQETIDRRTYWFPPSPMIVPEPSPTAHLLSIYDEYVSGYKDHSLIAAPDARQHLVGQGNALHFIVVLDGQIVGTWMRTLKKDAVVIQLDLFKVLTAAEHQAVITASQLYGEFLGLPVIIE